MNRLEQSIGITSETGGRLTEPRAVAPDAKVYFTNKPSNPAQLKLTVASGATALGSVLTCALPENLMINRVLLLLLRLSRLD